MNVLSDHFHTYESSVWVFTGDRSGWNITSTQDHSVATGRLRLSWSNSWCRIFTRHISVFLHDTKRHPRHKTGGFVFHSPSWRRLARWTEIRSRSSETGGRSRLCLLGLGWSSDWDLLTPGLLDSEALLVLLDSLAAWSAQLNMAADKTHKRQ